MDKFKLDTRNTAIIIIILVTIFSFMVFGFTGFRTIVGVLLLFLFPIWLILSILSLSVDEKIMFSFFLSIGFFPAFVYYLGFLVGIRNAIIVTFIVLIIVGVVIKRIKK